MKEWIGLCFMLSVTSVCYSGEMSTKLDMPDSSFFIGLGAAYNGVNTSQIAYGKGTSYLAINSGPDITYGVADGTGAPFHNMNYTFSPEVQAGYFKHFTNSSNLFGIKFAYQYLGSIATISNEFIPQLGQNTNLTTGATSSLYGWVNADSIQINVSHQLTLLGYLGRQYGNKYVYLGAGPTLFKLNSSNYNSIGYAEVDGVTVNVTGLISYSSPTIYALGGAAQLGATYFIDPTLFLDLSYSYALSSHYNPTHYQNFSYSSQIGATTYTTTGTIFTRNKMQITSQAITLSINKSFNV